MWMWIGRIDATWGLLQKFWNMGGVVFVIPALLPYPGLPTYIALASVALLMTIMILIVRSARAYAVKRLPRDLSVSARAQACRGVIQIFTDASSSSEYPVIIHSITVSIGGTNRAFEVTIPGSSMIASSGGFSIPRWIGYLPWAEFSDENSQAPAKIVEIVAQFKFGEPQRIRRS